MNTSMIEDALPFLRLYVPFVFAIGSMFYFAPAWIGRYNKSFWSIFALNFLFGWTIVGWLIALIWAVTPDRPKRTLWYPELPIVIEPEKATEEFEAIEKAESNREELKPILIGAALSILAVAILFGILSRGHFPLPLLEKTPATQVASAE